MIIVVVGLGMTNIYSRIREQLRRDLLTLPTPRQGLLLTASNSTARVVVFCPVVGVG